MRYMEDLKEMVCEELEKIAKKGELTASTLDAADKLTHTLKSITTTMAMDGYSERGGSYRGEFEGATGPYAGAYDGGSYDGSSYRRGRSMTTGRYISRASSRYSRDDGMKAKLEELMNDAPDEETRREIQRLIDKM